MSTCILRLSVFAVLASSVDSIAINSHRKGAAIDDQDQQSSLPDFRWPWQSHRRAPDARVIVNKQKDSEHRRAIVSISEERAFRQSLENIGDAQYIAKISVGGQKVHAVLDTGSFELLAMGANCSSCGNSENLFDATKSKSYRGSEFHTEHSFGSGTTNSMEAVDTISIGQYEVAGQNFWEVYDAQMQILEDGAFQAILGMGPPTSAIKFAEEDSKDVRNELDQYRQEGNEITPQIQETVDHYDDLLTHAKRTTSFVENLGLENVSFCLGKSSASNGFMIWNDHSTRTRPDEFARIDVVGDYYWSASMSDVKFGGKAFIPDESAESVKHKAKDRVLGCKFKECSAILDTGTTLLAAPKEVAERLNQAVEDWFDMGGTCDDLSKLPDLEFKLGGEQFSLPPEAYVGRVTGSVSEEIGKHMPNLLGKSTTRDCEAIVMAMEPDSDSAPTWILGMPFFRKYYTTFHFDRNVGSRPQATAMSFSIADSDCFPGSSPSASETGQDLMETQPASMEILHMPKQVEINVDASKIRAHHRVSRARAKKTLGLKTLMSKTEEEKKSA